MVSFKSLYQTQVTETGVIFDGLTEAVNSTTSSLADGADENLNLTINRAFLLCCIETNLDALVRVYGSAAGRAADTRLAGDPPTGTEESLIAEVDTTAGNLRIDLSPSVIFVNSDNPQGAICYLKVFNQSGGPATITTTLLTSTVGSATNLVEMHKAEVLRSAAFPIPSPTAPIPIVWDVESVDVGDLVDLGGGTPERVTIQQSGRYLITGTVNTAIPSYAGSGATETVLLIALNGTTFISGIKQLLTTSDPFINVSAEADLVAGDFITLDIAHDGGAAGPITTVPIAPPNDFPKLSVVQVPVAQGGGGLEEVATFTGTLGNGVDTMFVLNHNFGTQDVLVTVYRATAPYEEIVVDTLHTDANNVTVDFTPTVPLLDEFAFIVSPGGGISGGGGGSSPGETTTAVTSTGLAIVVLETAPEYHFVTPSANITFSVPLTPTFERRYVVKHEGVANTIDVDDGSFTYATLNPGEDVSIIYSTVDSSWRVE